MATVRDVVSGAFGRLSLLPVGSTLDPERAALGLTIFNDLVNELAQEGIYPGGPAAPNAKFTDAVQNAFVAHGPDNTVAPLVDAPLAYQLSDVFPFPSFFVNGFKSMLAAQLSDDAGVDAGDNTMRKAERCHRDLLAYFVTAPTANFDRGITKTPSHRPWRGGADLINGTN